jgi:hypothetical protein
MKLRAIGIGAGAVLLLCLAASEMPLAQRVAALENEVKQLRADADAVKGPGGKSPVRPVGTDAKAAERLLAEINDNSFFNSLHRAANGKATADAELTRIGFVLHNSKRERSYMGTYDTWFINIGDYQYLVDVYFTDGNEVYHLTGRKVRLPSNR